MKRGTREPEPKSAGGPVSDVMTLQEVADYLHCHYSTIHRLLRMRAIHGFRVGGWRFRRSDLDQWIKEQTAIVGTEPENAPTKPKRARGRPRKP